MYGESGTVGTAICPGEAQCEKWTGTGGRTRREKEKKVCHVCDLFPTKTERYKKWQKSLQRLVEEAIEIRQRRISGYPMHDWQFSPLHYEALLMLDAFIERREIRLKNQTIEILMAGFQLQKQ